ncbi:MAG TPA: NADH-quinone oxidoreductase subunit C [Paludibaculum sp.]|jgi:NADH-quinone oxidoreductase subunit C
MPDDPKPEGPPAPESAPKPEAPQAPPAAAPPKPEAASPAPADKPAADTPAAAPVAAPPAPKPAAPPAKPAAPAAPKPPAVMVTTPWESDLTTALAAEFGPAIPEFLSYLGQSFLVAQTGALIPLLLTLKDDFGFDYLVDVTAVHWPQREQPFDVIYVLYSFSRNERIRIKLKINEAEKPASATAVYPTADWLEREVYDMFGIEFADHPNMTRILMPDDWSTFPLRKENNILNMDQKWVQANLGIESGQ